MRSSVAGVLCAALLFGLIGLAAHFPCGALLISGYRNVVIFGAVNLFAVIVIAWLTISGFASIWCA